MLGGVLLARHALMNGSFIGFGALLTGGALLLTRPLGPWATGLLVVSGLSSVATGLAPLDQGVAVHAVAAGALERLALWPVVVGLAAFAWTRRAGAGG